VAYKKFCAIFWPTLYVIDLLQTVDFVCTNMTLYTAYRTARCTTAPQ